MLKNIWDTVTGNYRYIKYDGSNFHRSKGWSIVDRPHVRVGLACVAFNMANITLGNGDFIDIANGQWGDISNLTKSTLDESFYLFAIGFLSCTAIEQIRGVSPLYPFKNKAIDTEGRQLSSQLKLKEHNFLKSERNFYGPAACFFGLLGAFLETNELFDNGTLRPNAVMIFTLCYMGFERAQKILNGDYIICDKPPRKPERQKSSLTNLGGILAPN